jgi:hypothetical protein
MEKTGRKSGLFLPSGKVYFGLDPDRSEPAQPEPKERGLQSA